MGNIKSPLNLLILLGLICQGMAWNSYYALFIFCFLWFLLNLLIEKGKAVNEPLEIIILLAAFVIFFYYAGNNLFEKCIALGNGLAILQIIRLTYSLDYRKKVLAFAIALTQIAIGTQIFLDYAFSLVLLFLIILIPKFLYSIQFQTVKLYPGTIKKNIFGYKILKHKTEYLLLLLISILFFLFFPRMNFEPNSGFYKDLGISKNSLFLTKPNLKTSLKSVSEDDIKKDDLIFQVYADNLNYLKMMSMDNFNGDLWTISTYGRLIQKNFKRRIDLNGYRYRKVDIKYENYKSKFLLSDGDVVYLEGNFFDNPSLTRLDNIVIPENINRENKTYEYWFDPDPPPIHLSVEVKERYTKIKGYSSKLEKWLTEIVNKNNSKYEKALAICNYLGTNFKYELGAPALNKKYPVEDFIFYEKRGHCERFASALAVLLRILDIPSRVTVGYLAREKNEFGNYYNIRAKDAHAWTEAYFEGKGWVVLDATPAANFDFYRRKGSGRFKEVLDYVEYIWYSKIVNMSYGDQLYIYSSVGLFITMVSTFITEFFLYLLFATGIIFLVVILWRFKKKRIFKLRLYFNLKRKREVKLEHFYARLLRILLKHKIDKPDSLTPYEFLLILKNKKINNFSEIEYITVVFCKMKYGSRKISGSELRKVEKAIDLINEL